MLADKQKRSPKVINYNVCAVYTNWIAKHSKFYRAVKQ